MPSAMPTHMDLPDDPPSALPAARPMGIHGSAAVIKSFILFLLM